MDTSHSSASIDETSGTFPCPVRSCKRHFKIGKTSFFLKHFKKRHPTKILFKCNHCVSFITVKRKSMLAHQQHCNSYGPDAPFRVMCYSVAMLGKEQYKPLKLIMFNCLSCKSVTFEKLRHFNQHIQQFHSDKSNNSGVTMLDPFPTLKSEKNESVKPKSPITVKTGPLITKDTTSLLTEKTNTSNTVKSDYSGISSKDHEFCLSHITTEYESDTAKFNGSSGKLYPCPDCGSTFSTAWNLKAHLIHRTGERNFHCDKCSYRAKRKFDLMVHKSRTHFKELPYVCEICHKSFGFVTNLKAHRRIHDQNREKEYKCEGCSKAYHFKKDLDRHKKKKHGLDKERTVCQSV